MHRRQYCLALLILCLPIPASAQSDCVVLLHGWARVTDSMAKLANRLDDAGYTAHNVKYATRRHPVERMAADAVGGGVAACRDGNAPAIHFVAHSLGAILVRYYLHHNELEELGRVVMLAPPNQGSELMDGLLKIPGFRFFSGPAGPALGTGTTGIAHRLPPVEFELGVIAGNRNINPLAWLLVPTPNDSAVSVASTRVEGMTAHIVLPVIHQTMMKNDQVIDLAVQYLQSGTFHCSPTNNCNTGQADLY